MATTTLSDVRGTLNSINDALSGAHGAEWLDLLKRLLQGRLVSQPFRVWKNDVIIRARGWTEAEIKAQFELYNVSFHYEWIPHSISMLLPFAEDVVVALATVTVSELGFVKPVSINDIIGRRWVWRSVRHNSDSSYCLCGVSSSSRTRRSTSACNQS